MVLASPNTGLLGVYSGSIEGRTFSYQALVLWNQLLVWVQKADSVSVFKTRLKT